MRLLMVWEDVLEIIKPSIEERGFYHWNRSFQEFKREFRIDAPQRAPSYLSLDFWTLQRPELIENDWYVIRLGRGNFAIFSRKEFPRPYLELSISDAKELSLEHKSSFEHMRKSFKILDYNLKSAENTLLELARYYGVYAHLTKVFENSTNYQIGPRGNMTQKFDVYMKRSSGNFEKFTYNGQVELDYTVWTENRVFVFEAKSMNRSGLDVGWHKMAYPSHRFISQAVEDGLKVQPVYLLRTIEAGENVLLLFIFDNLQFHNNGIILNEKDHWHPICIFRISLNHLLGG